MIISPFLCFSVGCITTRKNKIKKYLSLPGVTRNILICRILLWLSSITVSVPLPRGPGLPSLKRRSPLRRRSSVWPKSQLSSPRSIGKHLAVTPNPMAKSLCSSTETNTWPRATWSLGISLRSSPQAYHLSLKITSRGSSWDGSLRRLWARWLVFSMGWPNSTWRTRRKRIRSWLVFTRLWTNWRAT